MLHIRASIKMAQTVLEHLDTYFLHWVVQKALAMCICTSVGSVCSVWVWGGSGGGFWGLCVVCGFGGALGVFLGSP